MTRTLVIAWIVGMSGCEFLPLPGATDTACCGSTGPDDSPRALRAGLLCALSSGAEVDARFLLMVDDIEAIEESEGTEEAAATQHRALEQMRAHLVEVELAADALSTGFARVAEHVELPEGAIVESESLAESSRALVVELERLVEELESGESMGNLEIQDLMSRYNQAEQLAASVAKKQHDTECDIIKKIG